MSENSQSASPNGWELWNKDWSSQVSEGGAIDIGEILGLMRAWSVSFVSADESIGVWMMKGWKCRVECR